jgi:hypothetical protein
MIGTHNTALYLAAEPHKSARPGRAGSAAGPSRSGQTRCRYASAFTYIELMVASAIGLVLIALLLILTLYGQQSFGLMSNYSELDCKSRNTVMVLSKEIREATRVIQAQTTATGKSLTLTNAVDASSFKLVWDAADGTLTIEQRPGITNVLLTGCDEWDYTLYDGAPTIVGGRVSFTRSASPSTCKLIEMSWSCSRTLAGKPGGSGVESVRFGLRNTTQ